MRIDGENPKAGENLGFDNMGMRPITGTTDWKQYSIVLDVSENSTANNYGFIIVGTGNSGLLKLILQKLKNLYL